MLNSEHWDGVLSILLEKVFDEQNECTGKMGKIHFKDCVRNNFTLNDYELVLSWIFYSSLHRFCFHGAFPVHNFPILRGFSLIAYWIVRRQTMIDGT